MTSSVKVYIDNFVPNIVYYLLIKFGNFWLTTLSSLALCLLEFLGGQTLENLKI